MGQAGDSAAGGPQYYTCHATPPVPVPGAVLASPKVWSGGSYATVWVENHRVTYGDQQWFDLEYARFAPDGSLSAQHTVISTYELDENAVPIDYGGATVCSMLSVDGGFAITWHETEQERLMFALLDPVGALISEPAVLSADETLYAAPPLRAVWTGSRFGVVWGDYEKLSLAILDEQGSLLSSGPVMGSLATVGRLFLFWTDDHYAVWIENGHQALNEVYLLQVSAEGQPIGEPHRLSDPDTTYTSPLWVGQTPSGYRAVVRVRRRTDAPPAVPLGIYEFDRDGIETAPPQAIAVVDPVDLVWTDIEFGAIFGEDLRPYFGLLGLDGSLCSNQIELAAPFPTNDGTRVPTVGGFDWHDGVFGIFFSEPTAAESQRLYTEIACET